MAPRGESLPYSRSTFSASLLDHLEFELLERERRLFHAEHVDWFAYFRILRYLLSRV